MNERFVGREKMGRKRFRAQLPIPMASPAINNKSPSTIAPGSTYRLPRLPACQICHDRKVKCDNARPKCSPCAKSGTECIIVRSDGGPPISREYIAKLEAEAHLDIAQSDLENTVFTDDDRATTLSPQSGVRWDEEERVASTGSTPDHRETAPSTGLRGSGLNFMISLFSDPEWRNTHSDLLHTLAQASRPSAPNVAPNVLPSEADARSYFDHYLQASHVQKPFLLRRTVEDLFTRVHVDPNSLSNQETFRVYMILAIGSISTFRHRSHSNHPFGYYLAALQHFDPAVIRGQLSAIQDLLLIARFGIYYHIGTSIWEIARLCMRMCVEQRLHRLRSPGLDLLEDQMRRRVFWTCYLMDRYSSSTLNRPFAIADRDIKAEMPVDLDDSEIITAQDTVGSLDAIENTHNQSNPSEVSVFLHCVRLRRITSSIYTKLSVPTSPSAYENLYPDDDLTAAGQIITTMEDLIEDLSSWQRLAPLFERPLNLFQEQRWYELLKTRETFNLIRRAVDLAPKRDGIPLSSMLTMGLHWAIHLIHLYSDLFEQSIVTYTRSYFHMMITAGFFVMYYTSGRAALGTSHASECRRALLRCEQTLTTMAVDLFDAQHYVAVFKALRLHISSRLSQALDTASSQEMLSYDASLGRLNSTPDAASTEHAQFYATSELPYQAAWHVPPPFQFNDGMNGLDGSLSHASRSVANTWPPPPDPPDPIPGGFSWDFLNDDRQWNINNYAWGGCERSHWAFRWDIVRHLTWHSLRMAKNNAWLNTQEKLNVGFYHAKNVFGYHIL